MLDLLKDWTTLQPPLSLQSNSNSNLIDAQYDKFLPFGFWHTCKS